MLERMLLAGSGGQGVLLIGKLAARVASGLFPNVTLVPGYGAEVRGGTSNCHMIISRKFIASPIPELYDSILLMSQAGTDTFLERLDKGGSAWINASLCKAPDSKHHRLIPATEMAKHIGSVKAAKRPAAKSAAGRTAGPSALGHTVSSCPLYRARAAQPRAQASSTQRRLVQKLMADTPP